MVSVPVPHRDHPSRCFRSLRSLASRSSGSTYTEGISRVRLGVETDFSSCSRSMNARVP